MTKEINLYDNRVIFQLPEESVAVQDINKYFLTAKPDFAFVEQEANALLLQLNAMLQLTPPTPRFLGVAALMVLHRVAGKGLFWSV